MARKIKAKEIPKFDIEPTDPRYSEYEMIEEIMLSYGFTYLKRAGGFNIENSKFYYLENNYDVNHWCRHKKGFLGKTYKDFSIMRYEDDGWNAKHNSRAHKDIRKYYSAHIKIHKYLYMTFTNSKEYGITPQEIVDFANGNTEHANERSIATEILEKIEQKRTEEKEKKKLNKIKTNKEEDSGAANKDVTSQ